MIGSVDLWHAGALLLSILVATLAVATALLATYLSILLVAACVGRRASAPVANRDSRFAILVPAHNEELLLARLLDSLLAQDYPTDRLDVFVVADNCTDRTAEIARSLGAFTYEREDRSDIGKGFALRWLLRLVQANHQPYDAYIVFDADSVVRSGFLSSMDGRLQRGAHVIQGYYSVLNASESPLSMLRYAALASLHFLRPMGREALGLSCGLKGNGMCFRAEVLNQLDWQWFTLAEDVELHLALVRAGLRVEFAPEAQVDADMPVSFGQASSQNERWERGRLQMLRHRVPHLFEEAIEARCPIRLDAVIEQLIPPMSVPISAALAALAGALMLQSVPLSILAGIGLLGQAVHLLAGLVLVGAPARAYVALAYAPLYVIWKLVLYARALVSTRTMSWIRTARDDDGAASLGAPTIAGLQAASRPRDVSV